MSDTTHPSKDKLVSDLKVVVADAEELLKLTADQAGEKLHDVRGRIGERLAGAKERIAEAEAALLEKTKQAAHATDDYVHAHPWQSVGVAAGVAFLLGLLVSRR
ncbi:DUF883 family protein [Azoarcus sp. TTM-91]|uniref:ElaB/YqjD/DUF883 family membrane-anchored ribosome-binding protein n=1 Tax=Azoarcus indigens TaxID=29545 RepID=A0A4R6DQQ9_9RHOO|nr:MULTISPECIES: DUF883 family protein [Azoarcus]NMG34685.1 DUF883 family protein [Azoarcus sp. TTM-91]NMG66450.1 DUF883 family protein [Azoarcus indigens]TDN47381.1 ElaB/YqjD/DUF883 family membrane-anchored ribosome-binding protein [Azoarcus indigens]